MTNCFLQRYIVSVKYFHIGILLADMEKRKNRLAGIPQMRTLLLKDKARLIAKRSGDRLKLYEKLEEQKDTIMDLYEKKDFEELSVIFKEYENKTRYYLKKDLDYV